MRDSLIDKEPTTAKRQTPSAKRQAPTVGSSAPAAGASMAAGTGQGAGRALAGARARARPETRQCTLVPPKPKLEMATVPPTQGTASATTWRGLSENLGFRALGTLEPRV